MKRIYVLVVLALLAGCLGGDAVIAEKSPGARVTGIEALPAANSGQNYNALVTPIGGVSPYSCAVVNGPNVAGNNLRVDQNCRFAGSAPFVTTDTIFPFKLEVTEANGETTVLNLHLTVQRPPLSFELPGEIGPATKGQKFTYDFCNPPGQANCGKDPNQVNPTGGNPPYSFTVRGQPLGLFIGLTGVLTGTVPKEVRQTGFQMEVCMHDLSGSQKCDITILLLEDAEEPGEPTATPSATATPGPITPTPTPQATEWMVHAYGNGEYDEKAYGVSYEYDARFPIEFSKSSLAEGVVEGDGTGWVRVTQTDGVCTGTETYDIEFSISGTVFEGKASILLLGGYPSSYLLEVDCPALGYKTTTELFTPFDSGTKFVTVNLEPGTKTTEQIKLPWDPPQTNNWTFEVEP